jgi:hypothetical protein
MEICREKRSTRRKLAPCHTVNHKIHMALPGFEGIPTWWGKECSREYLKTIERNEKMEKIT